MLVCCPPHCGVCCVGLWPLSWWGVLCWCVAPLMVGLAVLLPVGRGGGAWCGRVWLGLSSSVRLRLRLCRLPRRGWCCAGACPPPPVGACCVCVWPPPWWGLLCWCLAPPMVGRAALVCGPPHGGACCVGMWPPSWWGVLCWCLPVAVVLRGLVWWCLAWVDVVYWVGCGCGCVACLAGVGAVLVRAPPPCWGVPFWCVAPPWWGVLCRRVRVGVRGVEAGSMLGLFCWFAVVSAAVRPALSGVGCLWCLPGRGWCCAGAWPPPCWGVLCWCVPPRWWGVLRWFVPHLMVGRAVLVRWLRPRPPSTR